MPAQTRCLLHGTCFARNFSTKRLQASYNVLRVTKEFTPEEIRSKYLKLVKIYHPDNTETGNLQRFRQIQEAYNRIKKHQSGPASVPDDSCDARLSEEEYNQQMRENIHVNIELLEKNTLYNPAPRFYTVKEVLKWFFFK